MGAYPSFIVYRVCGVVITIISRINKNSQEGPNWAYFDLILLHNAVYVFIFLFDSFVVLCLSNKPKYCMLGNVQVRKTITRP